jgi:flagellar biosynthesis chaperone FliJ
MPKPNYRLQIVLDLRKKAQEKAARITAEKRRLLLEAEAELLRRQEEVNRCRAQQMEARQQMYVAADQGINASQWTLHRTHLSDLKQREQEFVAVAEEQRAVVGRAEAELERAIAGFIEATRQARMIETHKEFWLEQTQRQEEIQQQKVSDEIGSLLFTHRKVSQPH